MPARRFLLLMSLFLGTLATTAPAKETELILFGNQVGKLALSVEGKSPSGLNGRLSFDIRLRLGPGTNEVNFFLEDFYLVIFQFPYSLVVVNWSGPKPEATLGISAYQARPLPMSFDKQTNTIKGTFQARALIPAGIDTTSPKTVPKGDTSRRPTPQTGKLFIEVKLSKSLNELSTENRKDIPSVEVTAIATLDRVTVNYRQIRAYAAEFRRLQTRLSIANLSRFVPARNLCVLPVKIVADKSVNPDETGGGGASLNRCGKEPAMSMWRKISNPSRAIYLIFQDRWGELANRSGLKVVNGANYDTFPEVAEDCIEVFFVKRFESSCWIGGAYTENVGAASAYVVIPDEIALVCNQKRILAHELGHAMALEHPDEEGPLLATTLGSFGTVMCGRGDCLTDTPEKNSSHNILHAHNDLFMVAVALRNRWTTDCDHADCDSDCR